MRGRVAPVALVASALLVPLVAIPLAPAQFALADGPHGTQIAWTQVVDRRFSTARIVVGHPDGSGVHAVSFPGHGDFDNDAVVSPDGRWVLFERDNASGAQDIVAAADGSGEHVLDLGCVDPCALDSAPSWSPGGRRVVFTRIVGPFDQLNGSAASAVLWSARLDGSDLRRLSEPGIDGAYEDYRARFAPGGYVIFLRTRNSDGHMAVFRMGPDGTQVRQLTPWELDADIEDVSPATFGPTKDLVVFETNGHGHGVMQDIATVPATCAPLADCVSRVRLLTDNGTGPQASFNPSWSPDGQQVAFTAFDPGPPFVGDIWRMRADGTDAMRVSPSPHFDFRPDWGVAPSE